MSVICIKSLILSNKQIFVVKLFQRLIDIHIQVHPFLIRHFFFLITLHFKRPVECMEIVILLRERLKRDSVSYL